METLEVDGWVLSWESDHEGALLGISSGDRRPSPSAGRSAFRLTARGKRLGVGMAFLPTTRVIDVSIQPAVLEEVLAIEGGSCRPGSCGSIVAGWIARLADLVSAWRPIDPDVAGVNGTIGGAAFPLLGAAYDRGASPLREIPRWAAPVLAQDTARAAAGAAFGPKATRPVVASLASGLVQATSGAGSEGPGDDVAESGDDRPVVRLLPLGLALMGEPVLEPDRLARVLRQADVSRGSATWPTREQVTAFRRIAPLLGPVRTERLLCDALDEVSRRQLLSELIETLPQVGHLLPRRIANRLEDLVIQCRCLLPVDPNPQRGGWRPLPARETHAATRRAPVPSARRPTRAGAPAAPAIRPPEPPTEPLPRPRDPRRRALLPPRVPERPDRPVDLLRHPQRISELHGITIDEDLRLVIPRSGAELAAWGARLGNCVGRYGPAVASGRSLLFGIEVNGALAYCLELESNGSIRQFLGHRNRPVPSAHASPVCRHLASVGVVDPDNPANQPWLARNDRGRASRISA